MKIRTKFLFMVSVFFVSFLLFSSCGIPTIFYMTYTFVAGSTNDGNSIQNTFNFNDTYGDLSLVDVGTGPSLMMMYYVSDSSSAPEKSTIISDFKTTYGGNTTGKNISYTQNNPKILSSTYNSTNYALYPFSDSSDAIFSAPKYIANANSSNTPNFSFTLAKNSLSISPIQVDLALAFNSGSYTSQTLKNLLRFNGKPFTTVEVINDSIHFPEYASIDTDASGTSLYVHVYAAVSVASGSFSNIYWTGLEYLGYITLL